MVARNVIDKIIDLHGWTDEDIRKIQSPTIDDLHDPFLLENVDDFVDELHDSIHKKVLIMPDYDADGILSGSLVAGALSVFGFERVDVYAPRTQTGYGVTVQSAKEAIELYGVPEVVVTTDNGSNAFEGIQYFKDLGAITLVSDHHKADDGDPGDINVNPQRPTDTYPNKGLSGAAVIWKIMQAYAAKYGDERTQRLIDQLIVLVGISVLSDVMPLLDENRYIVQTSIEKLQDKSFLLNGSQIPGAYGTIFSGLLALYHVCDLRGKFNYGFDESTFGFVYGPMLNSPRRMNGSSKEGFDLFLSETYDESEAYAEALYDINEQRKKIMRKESKRYLEEVLPAENKMNYMVGISPTASGMIGLLAGQFTNRFNLPSIAFSAQNASQVLFDDDLSDEDIDTLSGSARSPSWFDLHGALTAISLTNPEIFRGFGGHKQAAGLSIDPTYYGEFRALFETKVHERLLDIAKMDTGDVEDSHVWIDWESLSNGELLQYTQVNDFIEKLKPFGHEFYEPAFGVAFSTEDVRVQFMGADKQHVKFELPNRLTIIQWNGADALRKQLGHLDGPFEFEIVGTLSINEFRGNKTIQIIADELIIK